MVFLAQLTVAVLGCFVWAANVKNYSKNMPNMLELLKSLDGLDKKTSGTMFRRQVSVSWPIHVVYQHITSVTEWCSWHYALCLILSLILQILLVVKFERRWQAGNLVNVVLWFLLLMHSRQRLYNMPFLSVLLSGLACCVSLYQLLVTALGDRIFGQIKQERKKKKVSDIKTNIDEDEITEEKVTDGLTRKLKVPPAELMTPRRKKVLPEELLFADEDFSLDENIGSLSLGPRESNRKQSKTTGSWFRSNLCPRISQPNGLRNRQATCNNLIIWPAKFHLNGWSLHAKTNGNGVVETQRKNSISEFSDDEFCLSSGSETRTGKVTEHSRCFPPSCERCNVLVVILTFSLALNACFLWLLRDLVKKALFKT